MTYIIIETIFIHVIFNAPDLAILTNIALTNFWWLKEHGKSCNRRWSRENIYQLISCRHMIFENKNYLRLNYLVNQEQKVSNGTLIKY